MLWCLLTGIAISCVTAWLRPRISHGSRLKRAMVLGCLLFGMDLVLFDFWMPLVFAANIPVLIVGTFSDIVAVTFG